MRKTALTVFTLSAFFSFETGCIVRTVNQESGSSLVGTGRTIDTIIKVRTESGLDVVFDAARPARLAGDEIRGEIPAEKILKSEAGTSAFKSPDGTIIGIVTADGTKYEIGPGRPYVSARSEARGYILRRVESGLISIPLSEAKTVSIRGVDPLLTLLASAAFIVTAVALALVPKSPSSSGKNGLNEAIAQFISFFGPHR